jgi:hypothetical protein
MAALSEGNIKSGFKAIELVLYNSKQMLSWLNTQITTPIPPGTSYSS